MAVACHPAGGIRRTHYPVLPRSTGHWGYQTDGLCSADDRPTIEPQFPPDQPRPPQNIVPSLVVFSSESIVDKHLTVKFSHLPMESAMTVIMVMGSNTDVDFAIFDLDSLQLEYVSHWGSPDEFA